MSGTPEDSSGATPTGSFTVAVLQKILTELRARIAATRWPSQAMVAGPSQGLNQAMLQELARYWVTEYDWRRCETELNALPQYVTEIDGLGIHFIHVKSPHENALPLLITHGWPGSVIEMLGVVGLLTDPAPDDVRAGDAFHLVLPSLPGHGFSGQPTEVGWDASRTAQAWAELMRRLGYTRYVAQGGDIGASVTDAMARQAPPGLAGIHLNFLPTFPSDVLTAFTKRGYIVEMPEHQQTVDDALTNTPVGLAAWMLDQDADSYQKISRAFLHGNPSGGLTRDRILDNITLYWLTNTATSSARLYWETERSAVATAASGQKPPELSLPVAITVFPGEIFQPPRSWAEKAYPNLFYFNEAAKGGHFAAWEEPQLFSVELRAAFRSLR